MSIGNDGVRSNIIKEPFGYLGCKAALVKDILPHLPQRSKYIEHFGGTGVILLNRQPSKLEVFNDASSGVTAFFKCCADPILIQKLCGRVRYMIRSREEFVWCRDTWQDYTDTVERAARWYYMLQNSFNKKCRIFRRSTSDNGIDAALDSNLPRFYPVHERIKKVYIENLDWRVSFKDFDSDDAVHYMDPPYYLQENPYPEKFTKADHAEMLERIFDMSGFVAVSGYDSDLYSKYKWDEIHRFSHKKKAIGNVNLDSNNREHLEYLMNATTNSTECLFIKKEK